MNHGNDHLSLGIVTLTPPNRTLSHLLTTADNPYNLGIGYHTWRRIVAHFWEPLSSGAPVPSQTTTVP